MPHLDKKPVYGTEYATRTGGKPMTTPHSGTGAQGYGSSYKGKKPPHTEPSSYKPKDKKGSY